MTKMIQAELNPSELAYLLHTLQAGKVVGVNNAQLFPTEPAIRDALLQLGFEKLQEHGWFVAVEDQSINANDRLLLMVAVMADPALVLTATARFADDAQQVITYYVAEGIVIEQFMSAEGNYVLSQLESVAAITGQLQAAFAFADGDGPAAWTFKFGAAAFQASLAAAKAGAPGELQSALAANGVTADRVDEVAGLIANLRVAGQIEGAAIAGDDLLASAELGILRAPDRAGEWLLAHDRTADEIELTAVHGSQFEAQLGHLIQSLAAAHQKPYA